MDAKEEDPSGWEHEIKMYSVKRASPTIITTSWYIDMRQYLEHDTIPSHLSARKKRALKLKELSYQMVHGVLFRKHHNGV